MRPRRSMASPSASATVAVPSNTIRRLNAVRYHSYAASRPAIGSEALYSLSWTSGCSRAAIRSASRCWSARWNSSTSRSWSCTTGCSHTARASHRAARAYDGTVADVAWELRGTYLESCNCEAICPCRRIGGVPGGRSTYGECLGVLTWEITEGSCDGVGLAGLRVVIVSRYHDDEPRSPWTFVLFVDRRADEAQARSLVDIFTGAAGGTALSQFPWAFKPSTLIGWRPAAITIDHTPGRGVVRVGDSVELRIRGPVED